MYTDFFKDLATSIMNLHTEQRELAAIWLSKPINTPSGKIVRLAPDAMVKIENGKLVDFTGEPSHKVLGCFGTLSDQFEITVINLKTNEPEQVKL